MLSTDDIKTELAKALSEKRYNHTLGVADTAKTMASFYGADAEKAEISALLHDCSRAMTEDEMKELSKRTLFPDEFPDELFGIELYHSIASEVLAREKYGVTDNEILSAIRFHTTGKENMTMLEMIVYSADMIEPNRSFDGVEELRGWTFSGLKALTLKCSEHTVKYLQKTGKSIHGSTMKLYNELKND